MKKLIGVIIVIIASTTISFAQQNQNQSQPTEQEEPAIEITETDISEALVVVQAAKADDAKKTLYCDMIELSFQADEALDKNDEKKADEIGVKIEEKIVALGDDFGKAMEVVAQLDPEGQKGVDLIKAVDELDLSCENATTTTQ